MFANDFISKYPPSLNFVLFCGVFALQKLSVVALTANSYAFDRLRQVT